MNVEDTLELATSKTWCNVNDLMKLTGLSRSSALKIRNMIKDNLNYDIHTRDLPMSIVINYLNIDIEYLKSISNRKEKKIENNK